MSLRINTNISAIQSQNSMSKVTREGVETSGKLSSGNRIMKAADDAAGLAISEKLKAEIRSSKQANRNANDGISLVQTAEGGLSETSSILIRLRELAMQAASDTVTDSDRAMSSQEYNQLKNELQRISEATEFNGKKLLNGQGPTLDFHIGVGSHSTDDRVSYDTSKVNSGIHSLGVAQASITSKLSAQESLARIDQAINKVSGQRSELGSLQHRLVTGSNNLLIYNENMNAANSRIRDADYAEESAKNAKNRILETAGTAVMAQANVTGKPALKLVE